MAPGRAVEVFFVSSNATFRANPADDRELLDVLTMLATYGAKREV